MVKKKDEDPPPIAEIKHFTSRSRRGVKAIITEKVRPGSDSARFIESMEARRRARPCNDAIDMRGFTKNPTRFYLHKGIGHHFDEASYRAFREGVARYNGVFTIGTFEDITGGRYKAQTAHSIQDEKQKSPRHVTETTAANAQPESPVQAPPSAAKTVPPALEESPSATDDEYWHRTNPKVIAFGYYRKRREPRILYTTPVSILINSHLVHGKTKDLSLSGAQVLLNSGDWPQATPSNSEVSVTFPDFKNGGGESLAAAPYRIHRIELSDDAIKITLLRQEKESHKALNSFLQALFDKETEPSKIDPEDEIYTATALLYEQIFAHTLTCVPVFFRINEQGRPTAHTVGVTRNNQDLCNFFEDQNGGFDFGLLREPNRISHICYKLASETFLYDRTRPQDIPFGEATLIVFKDNLGSIFSIADFELTDADSFIAVLQFALAQKDCLILKLHASLVREIDQSKMASTASELAKKNSAAAKSLQNSVRSVFALALMTDITQTMRDFLSMTNQDGDAQTLPPAHVMAWTNNQWRPLLGMLNAPPPELAADILAPLVVIRFGAFPRRREERYLARTKAELEVGSRRYAATTRDISTRGLSLLVEGDVPVEIGQHVRVGLVSFGKKAYKFDLHNIPYRVTGFTRDKTTRIMLERAKTPAWNDITAFFREIIDLNRDKLTLCLDDAIAGTQARLYEDVLAAHLLVTPVFANESSGSNLEICRIAVSEHSVELADYFYTDDGMLDYRGLTKPSIGFAMRVRLEARLKAQTGDHALEIYFFKITDSLANETLFESATNAELPDMRARLEFINTGITTGTFRAFIVKPHPIGDLDPYAQESIFDGVRRVSRHRAAQLEHEMKSLIAYGELIDITQDVLRITEFVRRNQSS